MISDVIVRLLTEASVRAALVLMLAIAIVWSLRRASAELRHAVWKAGVLAVLLLPLGLFLMPRWKLAVLPAEPAPENVAQPEASAAVAAPIHSWIEPLPLPRARFPWPTAITFAWLAGCGLMLVREVRCRRRLARLLREADPVTDPRLSRALAEAADRAGYRAPFDCLMSRELRVPLACGVSRPTILLPERALEWSAGVLSDVLVHEMSHLRRRDPLWLWAARLGCALYWFHPLVWLATRRMLAESERACDDAVMRGGERPSGYAETLLFVASPQVADEPSPALAFVRRHGLERRIAEILAQGRNLRPLGAWSRGLLATFALAIGGVAAVAHPVATCAGTSHASSAPVASTPRPDEAPAFHAGGPARVRSAYVCNENKSAAHLESATVEVTLSEGGAEARLARPRISFENQDRTRAIAAVQLGLELPTTKDRMWEDVHVAPGGSGEVWLSQREWAAIVPADDAHRLVVDVTGIRFANGETWRGKDMVEFPASQEKHSKLGKSPAPKARTEEEEDEEQKEARVQISQQFPDEPSLPARFRNPPNAEVVILEARTPVSTRTAEGGQRTALLPAVRLENRTDREVVAVRLRYKAERQSHAVSGYDVEIPPHSSLVLRREQYDIWGEPAAMTVQLLGARFADGSVWGTLDSRIDTRDAWVYPLEGAETR